MSKKPALPKVVFARVAELVPSEENAKIHPPHQIAAIKSSIRQFGWTIPILANLETGQVVAGHGRRTSAIEIYEEGDRIKLPSGELIPDKTVPVIDAAGMSDEQLRAYMLADNRLAEIAGWDEELLRTELVFLDASTDIDIETLGFTEADLCKLLAGDEQSDEDGLAEREWKGMPEFSQKDKRAFRTIPVHFKDQEAVDEFAKLIKQKITAKTRFVWFPEIEIERYSDKRYVGEPAVSDLHPDEGAAQVHGDVARPKRARRPSQSRSRAASGR